MGYTDAFRVARVLQPVELPPRYSVGSRAGHYHLRAAPVRLYGACARADARPVRAGAVVHGGPDSRVHRWICAWRTFNAWRVSAGKRAATLERNGVSAGDTVNAR